MEHFTNAFGHGFDIEKDPSRKSGFRPARFHDRTGIPLLGDLRLEGFAAALQWCDTLTLFARDEERYENENINEAWAIREMLVHDLGADPARVAWQKSGKGTAKNVEAMKEFIASRQLGRVLVVTNLYHLDRSREAFGDFEPRPVFRGAEVLWLAASAGKEAWAERNASIARRFQEDLPARMVAETEGLAKLLAGEYHSSYEEARP